MSAGVEHKTTMNLFWQEYTYTVFMLMERMIQLPQENLIPGIVCILLEREPLPVIILYESNLHKGATVRLLGHRSDTIDSRYSSSH